MKITNLEIEGEKKLAIPLSLKMQDSNPDEIYPVNMLIGLNASGKTFTLEAVQTQLGFWHGKPADSPFVKRLAGDSGKVTFRSTLYSEEKQTTYRVESVIEDGMFVEETCWEEQQEEPVAHITEKSRVSQIIGYIGEAIDTRSVIGPKIENISRIKNIPSEFYRALDPEIERIVFKTVGEKRLARICYKDKPPVICPADEIKTYVSYGTLLGASVLTFAFRAIQSGGVFIWDDIESGMNHGIVLTILRMFMDKNVNKKGAVLICSTHDTTFLDIFQTFDGILLADRHTIKEVPAHVKGAGVKPRDAYRGGLLGRIQPPLTEVINLFKN